MCLPTISLFSQTEPLARAFSDCCAQYSETREAHCVSAVLIGIRLVDISILIACRFGHANEKRISKSAHDLGRSHTLRNIACFTTQLPVGRQLFAPLSTSQ